LNLSTLLASLLKGFSNKFGSKDNSHSKFPPVSYLRYGIAGELYQALSSLLSNAVGYDGFGTTARGCGLQTCLHVAGSVGFPLLREVRLQAAVAAANAHRTCPL